MSKLPDPAGEAQPRVPVVSSASASASAPSPPPIGHASTPNMIEVRGLQKSFGRKRVLDGVDLSVPRGSIFGFLGLNGAGKSTTIRILLGLLRADGGVCNVAGANPAVDPVEVRRRVGYMAENQTMYAWMRVREIITWCGRFYPLWDPRLAEELRNQMALAADAKVGSLSKGQSSKLALLLALAHRPPVVILDDPVLGLDPLARRDFLRDVIGHLQAREVTVFFSSHLLYEIEPICDRVAILHNGRIIASESVDGLRARVKRLEFRPRSTVDLRAAFAADQPSTASLRADLLDIRREGEHIALTTANCPATTESIRNLSQNGVATVDLNLDEIFEAFVAGRKDLVSV